MEMERRITFLGGVVGEPAFVLLWLCFFFF
jgi:hypothetical protein